MPVVACVGESCNVHKNSISISVLGPKDPSLFLAAKASFSSILGAELRKIFHGLSGRSSLQCQKRNFFLFLTE